MFSLAKLYQYLHATQASAPQSRETIQELRAFFKTMMPWLNKDKDDNAKRKLCAALNRIQPDHYLNVILFNTYELPDPGEHYHYNSNNCIQDYSPRDYLVKCHDQLPLFNTEETEPKFKELVHLLFFIKEFLVININTRIREYDVLKEAYNMLVLFNSADNLNALLMRADSFIEKYSIDIAQLPGLFTFSLPASLNAGNSFATIEWQAYIEEHGPKAFSLIPFAFEIQAVLGNPAKLASMPFDCACLIAAKSMYKDAHSFPELAQIAFKANMTTYQFTNALQQCDKIKKEREQPSSFTMKVSANIKGKWVEQGTLNNMSIEGANIGRSGYWLVQVQHDDPALYARHLHSRGIDAWLVTALSQKKTQLCLLLKAKEEQQDAKPMVEGAVNRQAFDSVGTVCWSYDSQGYWVIDAFNAEDNTLLFQFLDAACQELFNNGDALKVMIKHDDANYKYLRSSFGSFNDKKETLLAKDITYITALANKWYSYLPNTSQEDLLSFLGRMQEHWPYSFFNQLGSLFANPEFKKIKNLNLSQIESVFGWQRLMALQQRQQLEYSLLEESLNSYNSDARYLFLDSYILTGNQILCAKIAEKITKYRKEFVQLLESKACQKFLRKAKNIDEVLETILKDIPVIAQTKQKGDLFYYVTPQYLSLFESHKSESELTTPLRPINKEKYSIPSSNSSTASDFIRKVIYTLVDTINRNDINDVKELRAMLLAIEPLFPTIDTHQLYKIFGSAAVLQYLAQGRNYLQNLQTLIKEQQLDVLTTDKSANPHPFVELANKNQFSLADIRAAKSFKDDEITLYYGLLLKFSTNHFPHQFAREFLKRIHSKLKLFSEIDFSEGQHTQDEQNNFYILFRSTSFVQFVIMKLFHIKKKQKDSGICNTDYLAELIRQGSFTEAIAEKVCQFRNNSVFSYGSLRDYVTVYINLTNLDVTPQQAQQIMDQSSESLSYLRSLSQEELRVHLSRPGFMAFILKNHEVDYKIKRLVLLDRCSIETLEAGLEFKTSGGSSGSYYQCMGQFTQIPEAELRQLLLEYRHCLGALTHLNSDDFSELLKHPALLEYIKALKEPRPGDRPGCLPQLIQLYRGAPIDSVHLQRIAAFNGSLSQEWYLKLYAKIRNLNLPQRAVNAVLKTNGFNQNGVVQEFCKLKDEDIQFFLNREDVLAYIEEDNQYNQHLLHFSEHLETIRRMHELNMLNLDNLRILLYQRASRLNEMLLLKQRGMTESVVRLLMRDNRYGYRLTSRFTDLFIAESFSILNEHHTSLFYFLFHREKTGVMAERGLLTRAHVAILAHLYINPSCTHYTPPSGQEDIWIACCNLFIAMQDPSFKQKSSFGFIERCFEVLHQLTQQNTETSANVQQHINKIVHNILYAKNNDLSGIPESYLADVKTLNLSVVKALHCSQMLTSLGAEAAFRIPNKHNELYIECITLLHQAGLTDEATIEWVIQSINADNTHIIKQLKENVIPALTLLKQEFSALPNEGRDLVLTEKNPLQWAKTFILLKRLPLSQADYQDYLEALQNNKNHLTEWEGILKALEIMHADKALGDEKKIPSYQTLKNGYDGRFKTHCIEHFQAYVYLQLAVLKIPVSAKDKAMLNKWLDNPQHEWPDFSDVVIIVQLCSQVRSFYWYQHYKKELNSPYQMLHTGGVLCELSQQYLEQDFENVDTIPLAKAWCELKKHGLYPQYCSSLSRGRGSPLQTAGRLIQLKQVGLLINPFIEHALVISEEDYQSIILLQNEYLKTNQPLYREYQLKILNAPLEHHIPYQDRRKKQFYSTEKMKQFLRLVDEGLYQVDSAERLFEKELDSERFVDALLYIRTNSLDKETETLIGSLALSIPHYEALQTKGIYESSKPLLQTFYADYVAKYLIYFYDQNLVLHINLLPFEHAEVIAGCGVRIKEYLSALDLLMAASLYDKAIKNVLLASPNQALFIAQSLIQLQQFGLTIEDREILLAKPTETVTRIDALITLGQELYARHKHFILTEPVECSISSAKLCALVQDADFREEIIALRVQKNRRNLDVIAELLVTLKNTAVYEPGDIDRVDQLYIRDDWRFPHFQKTLPTALAQLKARDAQLYETYRFILFERVKYCQFYTDLIIGLHKTILDSETQNLIERCTNRTDLDKINPKQLAKSLIKLKSTNQEFYDEYKEILLAHLIYAPSIVNVIILLKGQLISFDLNTISATHLSELEYILDSLDPRVYYFDSWGKLKDQVAIPQWQALVKNIFIARAAVETEPLVSPAWSRDSLLSLFKQSADYAELYLSFCDRADLVSVVFQKRPVNQYDLVHWLKNMSLDLAALFAKKLQPQLRMLFKDEKAVNEFVDLYQLQPMKALLGSQVKQLELSTMGLFAHKEEKLIYVTINTVVSEHEEQLVHVEINAATP